jgi:hypothetical protein
MARPTASVARAGRGAPILAPAALVVALVAAAACAPDVVGGTRDVEDDACFCDCELGCGPEGPEQPDAGADVAAAQGTGSGDGAADGAGGSSPAASGAGGGGGGGGACPEGASTIEVTIDGEPHVSCDVEATLGALSHATAALDDGHTLVLSWNGGAPSDDACVGIALRAPGNETAENDWQSGDDCQLAVDEADGRVVGTFSATLDPVSDVELGARVLTAGALDLASP